MKKSIIDKNVVLGKKKISAHSIIGCILFGVISILTYLYMKDIIIPSLSEIFSERASRPRGRSRMLSFQELYSFMLPLLLGLILLNGIVISFVFTLKKLGNGYLSLVQVLPLWTYYGVLFGLLVCFLGFYDGVSLEIIFYCSLTGFVIGTVLGVYDEYQYN